MSENGDSQLPESKSSQDTGTSAESADLTPPQTCSLSDYVPLTAPISEPSMTVQSQEALKEIAQMGRDDLYYFCKAILGMTDLVPHVHGPVCRLLEDPTKRNKNIILPRSWFKSSVCSIGYPLWRAIRNPNIRILIAQNTATNANKKLAEIDNHVLRNETFRLLYPEVLPTKEQIWRTDSKAFNRTIHAPEGTFEAVGVKTQITSRHYDIIIEDDTVAPDFDELGIENVAPTKEDIGLAIGWHRGIFPLFISPKTGENVVVGTRWFVMDLMSWIQENQKNYTRIQRAVRETDGVGDPGGVLIWPERFDDTALHDIEAAMGWYMFSCLYLNNPIASADQIFHQEWFEFYETEPQDLLITTTVDPGGDPEDTIGKPDWNVVCTTGKSLITGRIYVLEVTRFRGSPTQLIEEIFTHARKWRPVKIGIEAVQYQKSIMHWVREKKRSQNIYFAIEPIVNTRVSKNARIKGLQPLVQAKMLLFRRNQQALISEMLAFPLGAHDDMADALSMHLPMWALTRGAHEEKVITEPDPMTLDGALAIHEEKRATIRRSPVNPVFRQVGYLPIGNSPFGGSDARTEWSPAN